jgi:hypothetical protein
MIVHHNFVNGFISRDKVDLLEPMVAMVLLITTYFNKPYKKKLTNNASGKTSKKTQ